MATTLQLNQSCPMAGLGTATFTAQSAMRLAVMCQATLPVASGVQIVINLNGSPVVTVGGAASNPTPTQPQLAASTKLTCAAADVVTVVLSSSSAVDSVPNNVKSIINLYQSD